MSKQTQSLYTEATLKQETVVCFPQLDIGYL